MNGRIFSLCTSLTLLFVDFCNASCQGNVVSLCNDELFNWETNKNKVQPITDETWQEICKLEKAVIDCVKDYASKCLPQHEYKLFTFLTNGTQRVFDTLCSEETDLRARFLKNAECLRDARGDIMSCNLIYEDSLKNASSDTSWDIIQIACCSYFKRIECATAVTRESCGDEAGQFIQDLLIEPQGTYLKKTCAKREDTCTSQHNSAHSIFSFFSVIILGLIFSLNVVI